MVWAVRHGIDGAAAELSRDVARRCCGGASARLKMALSPWGPRGRDRRRGERVGWSQVGLARSESGLGPVRFIKDR